MREATTDVETGLPPLTSDTGISGIDGRDIGRVVEIAVEGTTVEVGATEVPDGGN